MSPLYTWRDVERLLRAQEAPPWIEIAADLEALRVTCAPGRREEAARRLDEIFGPYLSGDGTMLELESTRDAPRRLRVEIGESDEDTAPWPRVIRPLWPDAEQTPGPVEPLPEGSPRLAAFYSYKGGVGRTTTLLATLGALLDRRPRGARVLVVDADLEAPGLTFDIGGPPDRFCLLDFLALVHDADDWTSVIPLAAERLRRNVESVELRSGRASFHFLPAHRDQPDDQLFDQPVSMEQLVRGPGRAHVIAAALAALGKAIGVDVVLVDLRAGVTEISSPLLLDPRVQTFLVTSCSRQSIAGTVRVLRRMAARAQPETSPEVVLTMIPTTFGVESIAELTGKLKDAIPSDARDVAEEAAQRNVHEVSFAEALIHFESVGELLQTLLPTTDLGQRAAPRLAALLAPQGATEAEAGARPAMRCEDIAAEAATIASARENVQRGYLVTPALQALAEQFMGLQLPAAVMLGARGAGKTFTWGQMILAEDWSRFRRPTGFDVTVARAPVPLVFPLLGPRELGSELGARMMQAEETVWKAVHLNDADQLTPMTQDELRTSIERWTPHDADALGSWTRWIAARLGLPASAGASVESIEAALRKRNVGVCLVVDGIDEAFRVGPDSTLGHDSSRLLHGLLHRLPREVERLRSLHLGVVTFAPREFAQDALGKEFALFETSFGTFALTWTPTEALRLVTWLLGRAGLPLVAEERVPVASYEELRDALKAFWGERVGSKSSRESETDRWVILSLSDFQGRLQARDLMRLMAFAGATVPEASMLTPESLATGLLKCSRYKVTELAIDVLGLKSVFTRMRDAPEEQRTIPFHAADFDLSPDEVALLETHGVVARTESGELFMPDIFRLGLGFRVDARGRAKLLALYRAAQPKHA